MLIQEEVNKHDRQITTKWLRLDIGGYRSMQELAANPCRFSALRFKQVDEKAEPLAFAE